MVKIRITAAELQRRAYGLGPSPKDITNTDDPRWSEPAAPTLPLQQTWQHPVPGDYDVSDTLGVDGPNHQTLQHEGARQAATDKLRIPRLTDTQLGALEVYIFDPAHAEVGDVFPGRIEGRTLIVDGDPERAWELLMAAANSAGASQDRYFENALLAVLSKLSRLTRPQPG